MSWLLKIAKFLCGIVLATAVTSNAADCNVSTAGAAFGAYVSLSGTTGDTIGAVKVTCTGTVGELVSYTVSADWIVQGGLRSATDGKTPVLYALYIDGGRSQPWGDGSSGSFVISDNYQMGTPTSSRSYYVYGRIFAAQTSASAGNYTANVTLQLNY